MPYQPTKEPISQKQNKLSTIITQASENYTNTAQNTNARLHAPPKKQLLPSIPKSSKRKTLVLDLDETLVHSSFEELKIVDIVLPVLT